MQGWGDQGGGGHGTCWGLCWLVLGQGADRKLSGLHLQPASAFHADAVCQRLLGRWQLVVQVIEPSSKSQSKIIASLLCTNEKCVTRLCRHRRRLLCARFGAGHCCKKKKIKQKTWASGLYWSGNSFLPRLLLLASSCMERRFDDNEKMINVMVQVPSPHSPASAHEHRRHKAHTAPPPLHRFVLRSGHMGSASVSPRSKE